MLDTQCSPKTPNNFDHAQSCQLIIELPPDEKPNGHAKKRYAAGSTEKALK